MGRLCLAMVALWVAFPLAGAAAEDPEDDDQPTREEGPSLPRDVAGAEPISAVISAK